jgi:hypothetical protein
MQGNEGHDGHLMAASNTYLVMDAGMPATAFTDKHELKVYLRRGLATFCNPLVYTFANGRAPTIMTWSKALAECLRSWVWAGAWRAVKQAPATQPAPTTRQARGGEAIWRDYLQVSPISSAA